MSESCPLCASFETTLVTDRVRFDRVARVLRCGNCSLVFLDQDSFQFPEKFYSHEYHQTYLTHVDPEMLDPARHHAKMLTASKPWIDRVQGLLTGREIVLDVGCSTGHVLTGIRRSAARVYGQELNHKEIAYCRNVLGLDVSDAPLEERFQLASFDYILLIFVLEHIAKPEDFLLNLKKFLKPGGQLIVAVPNISDPLIQFYRIPSFKNFYFCIEHLFYYSPQTIAALFAKVGMRGSIETFQEYPISNHLNWGYLQKPADTLNSRRLIPDIGIADENRLVDWEKFWGAVDLSYRSFLAAQGYADRIWCRVGVDKIT